eukprot:scaffold2353_cov167-Amphora_coffeaeformis.AAC.58
MMNGSPKTNVGDFGPHVPEDKVQFVLQTPYGRGLTIRTRKATKDAPQMRQIELVEWKHAAEQSNSTKTGVVKPQYLYSTADFPSVAAQVGDEVMCTFGRGKVTEIRVSDNNDTNEPQKIIAVLLSSWRLARRSRVSLYLQPNAVRVVRPKKIYEMNVHERIDAALAFKDQAAKEFSAKDYQNAVKSYAKAIDAVRYVQHKADSDNFVRADLLVVMVTCTNNAEVLLDAMENKKGMKIHTILVQDGYTDVQTFGIWKVKALMLQARALAEKQEFDKTIEILKRAHEIIATHATEANAKEHAASVKTLRNLEKEVLKLHARSKERKSLQIKKEKQRAAAMFGGSSKAPKVNENANNSNENENPAEPVEENGVSGKDKENQIPNGSTMKSTQTLPRGGITLPLKSKPDEKPTENGDGKPFKRRVSFSEKVTSYELPSDEEIIEVPKQVKVEEADDVAWYKDPEALLGAAIFGSAVVASSLIVSALLGRRGSR